MPVLGESGLMLSAFIHRGLAAPASLPALAAAALAQALQAVVDDPEFRSEGESSGFASTWLDGPAWDAQARKERAELVQLWKDCTLVAVGHRLI